jgi:hypothetical protein
MITPAKRVFAARFRGENAAAPVLLQRSIGCRRLLMWKSHWGRVLTGAKGRRRGGGDGP